MVALNKKAKTSFFSQINIKKDAKSFWDACKPFMASKPINNKERMMLNECGSVITDDLEVADTFNNYFTYISKTLDIPTWINCPFIFEQDPINHAVLKYRSHPSILSIKRSSLSLEKIQLFLCFTRNYLQTYNQSEKRQY